MLHPEIQLADVDESACSLALNDGAMDLSWETSLALHVTKKGDYSFFLNIDPLYTGIIQNWRQLLWEDVKRIVGCPAVYSSGMMEQPEWPCLWGDPSRRAPTLVLSRDLSWRGRRQFYCVRLPVPVDDVSGFAEAEFAITGEVAARVIREHMRMLRGLSVGPTDY